MQNITLNELFGRNKQQQGYNNHNNVNSKYYMQPNQSNNMNRNYPVYGQQMGRESQYSQQSGLSGRRKSLSRT